MTQNRATLCLNREKKERKWRARWRILGEGNRFWTCHRDRQSVAEWRMSTEKIVLRRSSSSPPGLPPSLGAALYSIINSLLWSSQVEHSFFFELWLFSFNLLFICLNGDDKSSSNNWVISTCFCCSFFFIVIIFWDFFPFYSGLIEFIGLEHFMNVLN